MTQLASAQPNLTVFVGLPANVGTPTVTQVTDANGEQLQVAFTEVPGGNNTYNIRYSEDEGATDPWTEVDWTGGSPAFLTGLDPETEYYVQIRAENGNGTSAAWSASDTATTTEAAPVFNTALASQSFLRGAAITPVDLEAMFTGSNLTISVGEGQDTLPTGLSISSNDLTGTPTERTTTERRVEIVATNDGGTYETTFEQCVIIEVTAPVHSNIVANQNGVSFNTTIPDGTVYAVFSTTANDLTQAVIEAGTGTGVDVANSGTVTGSGVTVSLDLSSHLGDTGYIQFLQKAADGSYSEIYVTDLLTVNLIEEVDLTDVYWTATGVSVTGSQADPDGGTGAYLVTATASNAGLTATSDFSISGNHKLSLWADAGASNWLRIALDNTNTWFNLSTGAVATQNHDAATIVANGSGYDITVTHNCDGTANLAFIPSNSDNNLAETSGNSFTLYNPFLEAL